MPQAQPPLGQLARTEARGGLLPALQERWSELLALPGAALLFDWSDRSALMSEIRFVNQARERLDEAALKIAPSMLRIVLTVKTNIADPREQRAFLTDHVDWDFRRISELCIVADRYALLDPAHRQAGAAEIARYGWSNALKLAAVPDAEQRRALWEAARGLNERASYRAVLEELKRFRERKLIGPPASETDVSRRISAVRQRFEALDASTRSLDAPERFAEALRQVAQAQHELGRLKRALSERMQAFETEALAQSA